MFMVFDAGGTNKERFRGNVTKAGLPQSGPLVSPGVATQQESSSSAPWPGTGHISAVILHLFEYSNPSLAAPCKDTWILPGVVGTGYSERQWHFSLARNYSAFNFDVVLSRPELGEVFLPQEIYTKPHSSRHHLLVAANVSTSLAGSVEYPTNPLALLNSVLQ